MTAPAALNAAPVASYAEIKEFSSGNIRMELSVSSSDMAENNLPSEHNMVPPSQRLNKLCLRLSGHPCLALVNHFSAFPHFLNHMVQSFNHTLQSIFRLAIDK